jgi:hypothetical protein
LQIQTDNIKLKFGLTGLRCGVFLTYAVLVINLQLLAQEGKTNFIVPQKYKEAALASLKYFPQLKNTKIIFKEANISTTMSARPAIASLFVKKCNRKYIIRINNNYNQNGKITLDEAPLNAQIGVIGHELAHIDDYQKRSFIGILIRGLSYFSRNTKEKFEKAIDLETIKCGLGKNLYSWSHYVLHESDASLKYLLFKKKIYLSPEDIQPYIEGTKGDHSSLE